MLSDEQALKNLAANLAVALDRLDWSQADLARAILLPAEVKSAAEMRVSRYIRGLHMPSGATLANMAEVLGVSVDWLLATHRPRKTRRVG